MVKDQQTIFEKILQLSPVGIGLVENNVFKWVNLEMLRLFGYDRQTFENSEMRMIYTSDDTYRAADKMIREEIRQKGRSDFDFDLKKRDGTFFKAHIVAAEFKAQGTAENIIVTLTDISQREVVQKERVEKEKLQGVLEMAGAVCHEINQPLQTILGYSTLYRSGEIISEAKLRKIEFEAKRIGDITTRLSNITQYKTVDYPGDTKIVDIWGSSNEE